MSDSITVDEMRAFSDPYFTGLIVEGFGMGIYTMIFFQAIWKIYKRRNRGFYFFALTLLWILCVVDFTIECNLSRLAFVFNNSSPMTIFTKLGIGLNPFLYVPSIGALIISDSILIWRCHVLWRDIRVLVALITLLVATAGLLLSDALLVLDHFSFLIGSLGVLSSFMTTISATSLIALKIVLVTRRSRIHCSYAKVVEILVESAALVSIVALGITVMELLDYARPYKLGTMAGRVSYDVMEYLSYLKGPAIGIGPTLTAFRVAAQPSQTEVGPPHNTSVLSRLTFRRTGHNSNTDTQLPHTQISTIRFGSAHEKDSVGSVQSSMDMQAQNAAALKKTYCSMETLETNKGAESV
ncbi:hypothetical protein D9619_010140 [Psilocybe cf. subviscida]|uniref:Uncharacterized protein n=1 Tax=Psilocybe cf. subviscida TaxID=2480587 RepID=A0A8H5ES31_9AGAR|nr:hypothetical protein D9619_010140 [Psilocybe cf. subviscida]